MKQGVRHYLAYRSNECVLNPPIARANDASTSLAFLVLYSVASDHSEESSGLTRKQKTFFNLRGEQSVVGEHSVLFSDIANLLFVPPERERSKTASTASPHLQHWLTQTVCTISWLFSLKVVVDFSSASTPFTVQLRVFRNTITAFCKLYDIYTNRPCFPQPKTPQGYLSGYLLPFEQPCNCQVPLIRWQKNTQLR